MQYWLLKTEPEEFSWDDMTREDIARWDGIRNFQARKHLREMEIGDLCLFYETGAVKAIVGIVEVARPAFPDPNDQAWDCVEVKLVRKIKNPVTLETLKTDVRLKTMQVVRQPRLSVSKVSENEWERIVNQ